MPRRLLPDSASPSMAVTPLNSFPDLRAMAVDSLGSVLDQSALSDTLFLEIWGRHHVTKAWLAELHLKHLKHLRHF